MEMQVTGWVSFVIVPKRNWLSQEDVNMFRAHTVMHSLNVVEAFATFNAYFFSFNYYSTFSSSLAA